MCHCLRFLPGLLAILLLAGCASTPATLNFTIPGNQPAEVWPDPPETPRYQLIGQLTGEDNIERRSGQGLARKLLGWLAGLISGPRQALVLQRPQGGIVGPEGRIYVTDVSRGAVYVFDESAGTVNLWEMADANTRFVTPVGVTVGRDDTVLVADAELGRVVRLDREGNALDSWGEGVLKRPTGLARDPASGLVYVADTHDHNIKVFTSDGELVRTIGHRGEKQGEFNSPTYLAFTHEKLYVTDTLNSRVQTFTTDGQFISMFGRRGLYIGDLPRPKGVAVDRDHNVYVVESYYDYLLVFNDKGELLLPIGGTGSDSGKFYLPAGVWTDQRDRIYVADAFNGRVMIFQYLGET